MITEFALSAPGLSRALKSEFAFQTRSLTSLYGRVFGKALKLGTSWKMMVEVVTTVEREAVRDLLGVFVIQVRGNPNDLLLAPDSEKPKLALGWLLEGLTKISHAIGLDERQFCDAADVVKLKDFTNVYQWGRAVRRKGGKEYAELIVNHGIYEAELIARVKTAEGDLICEKVLASTRPDELIFSPLLGRIRWDGNSRVVLDSRSGEMVATMSLASE